MKVVERLTLLHDHLATMPVLYVGKFDFANWMKRDQCGTCGCAGGEAALIPHFQAEGLRLEKSMTADDQRYFPVYRGATGLEALRLFFGLTESVALEVFTPIGYSRLNGGTVEARHVAGNLYGVIRDKKYTEHTEDENAPRKGVRQ